MSLNLFKNINNNVFKIGQSLSKESSKIGNLTKDANTLLSTIKSKHPDSKISAPQLAVYNSALNKLIQNHNRIQRIAINAKKTLVSINKVVTTLNVTVTTLTAIITVLQVLPAPAQFSTLGIIMTLANKLKTASDKIKDIKLFLAIINVTLKFLIELFNVFLKQLEVLNSIIQEIIELLRQKTDGLYTNSELETDNELYENDEITGNDIIGNYKDFIFRLKVEDDPKYNIGAIKRKYAVAVKDNKEIYYSERSYTLNPDILIQQLKLQIDTENT